MTPRNKPPKFTETQVVKKNDVGQLPAVIPTTAPLIPEDVGGKGALTEGARAFLDEAKGQRLVPTRIPIVKMMHDSGQFLLSTGELVDQVCGYPVYYFHTRRYYKEAFRAGASPTPPDCWSADMIEPHASAVNKQSEVCATCERNQFKTGRDGRSMACGTYTWIFLLNPEFGQPPMGVVVAPASSLRILVGSRFQQGYFGMAQAKHKVYEIVWTTFRLKRPQNDAIHCVLDPSMGPAATDPAQTRMIAGLRNQFLGMMEELRMKTPDLREEDTDPEFNRL